MIRWRTNLSGSKRPLSNGTRAPRSWTLFLTENRRLLAFTLLFMAGVLLGILIYAAARVSLEDDLGAMLRLPRVTGGFRGGISALFSSCFSVFLLLTLLFLLGLSACGAPPALLVPLFFGMGLGLTEAYYTAEGLAGWLTALLMVIPHNLLAAVALVLASMETVRMSLQFSRQLLPDGGFIGGLWSDFKLYCARFLVFFCLAFASGVLDVCLRLALDSLLI